ncbi:MAG: ATP-binding protein [Acidobacteriaceae bacterium]
MKRRVLLIATARWVSTARLGMAFAEVGCEVEILCPRAHPALQTTVIHKHYRYKPLIPLLSIERAIEASQPDLIVPCDELVRGHLHRLHATATHRKPQLASLIEYSLGDPASFHRIHSRLSLMEIAREEQIATPIAVEVASVEDLISELTAQVPRLGLPLLLKADESSGGNGVRLLTQISDAARLWKALHRPPSLPRTLNRMLMDSSWTPLLSFLQRRTRAVSAQQFVPGKEAYTAVACWQGNLLTCMCFEVVVAWSLRGPSSVIKRIENAEMIEASRKIVRRLGLSGFCGFDFICEEKSGIPQLIEMNARPTQVSHLALGPQHDIVAALYSCLCGEPRQDRPSVTGNELIAIFPQEWQRDPSSPMLTRAYHDVPWSEPGLIPDALTKPVVPVSLDLLKKSL